MTRRKEMISFICATGVSVRTTTASILISLDSGFKFDDAASMKPRHFQLLSGVCKLDNVLSWRPSRHTLQRRGYTSMSDSNCVRSLPRAFRSCRRMGPEWVAQLHCSTYCATVQGDILLRLSIWQYAMKVPCGFMFTSQSRKHMLLNGY